MRARIIAAVGCLALIGLAVDGYLDLEAAAP
jgi:hypothetical protein